MSHSLLQPLSRPGAASATVTATGQTGTLFLPQFRSALFILDVTANASTNDSTLDVSMQITPQSPGTPVNWYNNGVRFKQFTTNTGVDNIRVSHDGGPGEAGVEYQVSGTGAAGGPLAINAPFTRKYRWQWVIAGQTPSYTFAIWEIFVPKGAQRI